MHNRLIGAVLATLAMTACGSPSCAQPKPAAAHITCTDAKSQNHAYVVVQHMTGAWLQACVGFDGAYIGGETAMQVSGIEYRAQTLGTSRVVCQIDLEPSNVVGCAGRSQPRWVAFQGSGGHWLQAGSSYVYLRIYDSEVIGWRYVPADIVTPSPPPQPHRLGG
jgi:opacity protein-like surface antigen